MRRRLIFSSASIALSLSLIAVALPAAADSSTTLTAQEAATQSEVLTMLGGLQGVVNQVNANPLLANGFSVSGADPSSSIAAAQQSVTTFTPSELDALGSALAQDPSWPSIDTRLSGAVSAFTPPATSAPAPAFPGTFTDSCPDSNPAPAEFTATLAANEVQSAAQAAMLAAPGVAAVFPGVDVPTGVKIALAVVWGVANAVYLALSQALAVAQDCAATAFSNVQTSALPANSQATSSEISVQNLINSAGQTAAQISTVETAVSAVLTQAATLASAATSLNTTLSGTNNQVTEISGDLSTLGANISVLSNTETTIQATANQEIALLGSFQSLQLRMAIEENLTRTGANPIGLFQLPAQFGGYLEVVGSIVQDTITQAGALGHQIAQATTDLGIATSDYTAGKYKAAYSYYAKAYQDAR